MVITLHFLALMLQIWFGPQHIRDHRFLTIMVKIPKLIIILG
jgi:hypothetical protein